MILRSMPSQSGKIFLTFDDGPDPVGTAAVLDVLARKKVPATFFLIAERVRAQRDLVQRIQDDGHAIGNHSLDHRYRNFFRGDSSLKTWLEKAEAEFSNADIHDLAGFRPPAGIVTPRLKRVAADLDLEVILWNERFYDAVIPWGKSRALKSAAKIKSGSIVLLHDRQLTSRILRFCETLELYIDAIRARGLEFDRLTSASKLKMSIPTLSKHK
ncbi:MAG: polysaccharide deacetylase family protein [Bdellovibrionales bacterium]